MEELLIQSVHIIDPQSSFHDQLVDLRISGGKIVEIGEANGLIAAGETLKMEGIKVYASPGWVDMEAHLCDPGFEHRERLEEMAQAASFGGFTRVLAYPNTDPVLDKASILSHLVHRAASLPTQVHFTGKITASEKSLAELYEMHQRGALAFTNGDDPLDHQGLWLRALQYTKIFDGLTIKYPFNEALAHAGQMVESETSLNLGMGGVPEAAESSALAADLETMRYEPGRVHIQPLTSPRAWEILRKAKEDLPQLSGGIPLAYVAFDDRVLSEFDPAYKLSPPLRHRRQVEQLHQFLQDGTIQALTTGHRAQEAESKDLDFVVSAPGMLGLQTYFALSYQSLIEKNIIDLSRWVELSSLNPRAILKLPPATIAVGAEAEITLFSPDIQWTFTKAHLFSPAVNSPLLGKTLKGKALGIFAKGRWHSADTLVMKGKDTYL
ncbi:MAG: hypothetical protein AAFV78_09795 [Bacteroidota bacterium]